MEIISMSKTSLICDWREYRLVCKQVFHPIASILKACHSLPALPIWCWLRPSMITSAFDWQSPVSCCSICWQQYPCVKQIPLFLWCTPSVLFYMTPLTFFFNFDQHYLINQLVKWSEMSTFTSIIKSLLNLTWRFSYLHKYL